MNEDDIKYRLLIKNLIKIPFACWTDRKEEKRARITPRNKKESSVSSSL
jgi:hypothetical protein